MDSHSAVAGPGAPPLFHVSARTIPPGERLRPYAVSADYAGLIRLAGAALRDGPDALRQLLAGGVFARLREQGSYRIEMVLLEAAFERARQQTAPHLPSRLESVYVWRTLARARQFQAVYRPDGIIHRCALLAGTTVERDGALIAAGIDLTRPLAEELALVEQRAVRYWRAREPMLLPETLVHGTIVIEAALGGGGDER